MKTRKMRLQKMYRAFGNFSQKYIQPAFLVVAFLAITYWIGIRIYRFTFEKTSSVGWSLAVTILVLLILGALGAANDAEEEKAKAQKAAQKGQTPKKPAAKNPLDPGSGIQPPPAPHI